MSNVMNSNLLLSTVGMRQRMSILFILVTCQFAFVDFVDAREQPKTQNRYPGLKSENDNPPRPRFLTGKNDSTVNMKQDVEKKQERDNEEKDLRPKITRSASPRVNKNKVMELTFDDIAFEMEKGDDFERSMLTEEINNLNNQKVRLRGFIRPSVKQSGLTKFVFVRDNKECCFGPGAAIFDCVLVELAKGKKTDFTVRPVTIEGEFYLKEFKGLNGKIWAIYRMKKGMVK